MSTISEFSAISIGGEKIMLSQFAGKVLLIVNTASECGYTSQYAGLEKLQQLFAARGFSVLAFPCNQFGKQEPGNAEQIHQFCQSQYHITFPLFAKVEVNGEGAHPLFTYLTNNAPGFLGTTMIKWNFTKFLIDQNGKIVQRYAPFTKPENLIEDIEALLVAGKK